MVGIRLTYRVECHVEYVDDGKEWEIEKEEEDEDKEEKQRKSRKRKGRRRNASEKFLETTSILWGTGNYCQNFDQNPSNMTLQDRRSVLDKQQFNMEDFRMKRRAIIIDDFKKQRAHSQTLTQNK